MQLVITKQSRNPLCDGKTSLEYDEWMRKHTSLSERLDKSNENEKTIKSELSSISNSLSKASTFESSKFPLTSLSLKEINNNVNEYDLSSV